MFPALICIVTQYLEMRNDNYICIIIKEVSKARQHAPGDLDSVLPLDT
jgi:hypothetical protein